MHCLAHESIEIEVVLNLTEIIGKNGQVYPYNLILVLMYSILVPPFKLGFFLKKKKTILARSVKGNYLKQLSRVLPLCNIVCVS
jgi:hypothetical protein